MTFCVKVPFGDSAPARRTPQRGVGPQHHTRRQRVAVHLDKQMSARDHSRNYAGQRAVVRNTRAFPGIIREKLYPVTDFERGIHLLTLLEITFRRTLARAPGKRRNRSPRPATPIDPRFSRSLKRNPKIRAI